MLALLSLLACGPQNPEGMPTPLPGEHWTTTFTVIEGGYGAEHPVSGLRAWVQDTEVTFADTDFEFVLRPEAIGRRFERAPTPEEDELNLEAPPPVDTLVGLVGCPPELVDGQLVVTCDNNRAWYKHDERGLEFGIDLQTPPPGEGELLYRLGFESPNTLSAIGDTIFVGFGEKTFEIAELRVTDANGTVLPSQMFVDCAIDDDAEPDSPPAPDCAIAITADDSDAVYPVRIDPMVGTKAATTCTGSPLPISSLLTGNLVITEMMINPDIPPMNNSSGESRGEWIEITNTLGSKVNLLGAIIHDYGTNTFTITSNLCIPANGTVVIGGSTSLNQNGQTPVDLAWSNIALNNVTSTGSSDEIVLSVPNGGPDDCRIFGQCTEIDAVAWDTSWRHAENVRDAVSGGTSSEFFMPESASLSLHPPLGTAANNDVRGSWCDGFEPYASSALTGGGQFGTPNAPNESCTAGLPIEFTWDVIPTAANGGLTTFSDCINVNPTLTGTFTSSNSGDGLFSRYTYHGSANKRGQFLNWTYLVNGVPTEYWALRDFDTTVDYDFREVLSFDPAIVTDGNWITPCL